jgi:glycosyltransferase involved in cell wall biosynthesis
MEPSRQLDQISSDSVLIGKRILHCYVTAEFGGLANAFISISNAFFRKGAKVTIALQTLTGELIANIEQNINVVGLGYRGVYSYPLMAVRLYGLVRRLRPDIVISHSWNCNVLAIIAFRACKPRPKLILYEHTPVAYYGLYKGFQSLLKPLTIFPLYRQADALFVVSEGIRQEYEKKYFIPREIITVIPPPVDIHNTLNRAREPVEHPWFNENIPIVISVAPLTPAKDFKTLLNAFAIIRAKKHVRLVLVGDGPERGMLENTALQLGIEKDFQILGYQPNPYKYMIRSSIFASTSAVEGFGIAIVEALALGLPVVATKCAGPIDILENGKYGLLTPACDSMATAFEILKLLSDETLYASLARSGRERAYLYESSKVLKIIENTIANLTTEKHCGSTCVSGFTG